MTLEVEDLGIDLGGLSIEASFTADEERLTVLLGPNGSGKTTILRALAGVVPVARGRISYRDTVLTDAKAGTAHAPHERPIAMVWQSDLLFPHLNARDNIAYGLVAGGKAKRVARTEADRWLARLGLSGRADTKPAELSGGESQKVALARALILSRPVVLLDEPFSALDVSARWEARRTLMQELQSVRGVKLLVTHDPLEAIALADKMIVLEGGRITQQGTSDELKRRPATTYIASLVGVNLLRGRAEGDTLTLESGGKLTVPAGHTGPAFARIHPRAVSLFTTRPEGSPRNVWRARVAGVERGMDDFRVSLEGEIPIVAEITERSAHELTVASGNEVWAAVKATEIEVYPA